MGFREAAKKPHFWSFLVTFMVLSGPSLNFLPSQSLALLVLAPVWMLLARGQAAADNGPYHVLVLALPFWLFCTVLWTSQTGATALDAVVFLSVTVIAMSVARLLTFQTICHFLGYSAFGALLLSLAVAAILPQFGLVAGTYQTGALQGFYPHRNILAFTLVVGFTALIAKKDAGRGARQYVIPLLLGVGVVLTSSSTALTLLVLAIAARLSIIGILKVRPTLRPALLSVVFFALVLTSTRLPAYFSVFAESLGRDATLTGRTDIWQLSLQLIEREPILGYGWGAVWGGSGAAGNSIVASLGFYIDHAHNGFLDLALQAGLVGAGILCVIILIVFYRAVATLSQSPVVASWILTMVTVVTCYNLVETRLTRPLGWFVVVLLVALQYRKRVDTIAKESMSRSWLMK